MKSKFAAILAAPSLWAFASATHAEPAEDQPDETAGLLGEVIVTARRRAETLQEVPQTVSVVTGDTLKKFVILKFEDISQLVPGLTLESGTTGYQANASVRGVRFEVESQASGPTTEFYVNDAPMDANSVFQGQYDIGQIEVLKGPQGTVRGRSAPSGAFTLTTQPADPDGGWNGYVATTFDDHDGMNLQAAVNVPVIEDLLALRVAGLMDENDANGIKSISSTRDPSQDTDSYRVSLTLTPGDAFRASLMYQNLERDEHTYGASPVFGPGGIPANPNRPPLTMSQYRSVKDRIGSSRQALKMATAKLDYAFAGQVLSYVGGWLHFDLEDDREGDSNNYVIGPSIPLNNAGPTETRTHEIRLASEERLFNGFLDYTVGAFYMNWDGELIYPAPGSFWPGAFGAAGAPDPTVFNDNYYRITRIVSTKDNTEKSYFAGVDLHLTKSLDLSLGARHIIAQRDELVVAAQQSAVPGGVQRVNLGTVANCAGTTSGIALFGVAGATLGTGTREPSPFYSGTCDAVFTRPFALNLSPPIKDEVKHDVWNASLSYKFTDNFMAYATTGTSFRNGPGFVTGGPGTNCANLAYCLQYVTLKPEESLAYELGFKAYLFDRRGYLEVAAFQQKFDGFIVFGSGVPYRRGGTSQTVTSGAFTYNADAIVTGFDALFNYDITKEWDAGLSVSYADGEYDNAPIPCRDSNFDGIPDANPLPGSTALQPLGTAAAWDAAGGPGGPALCASNGSATTAPVWNASLRTQYEFPLFAETTGFVRGLYTYYPENENATEDQNFVVAAYGVLNLYAGLRSDARGWEISAFVRNVLDEDTLRSFSDDFVPDGLTNGQTNQPYFSPQTAQYSTFSRVAERELGVTLRYNFGK